MRIINTTPHDVVMLNSNNEVVSVFPPELSVRVSSHVVKVGELDGFPLEATTFGELEGLPAQEDGVFYIVSRFVKSALPNRHDLICPGQQVRDGQGRVIGCKSFSY